jgi:signal transduction histidine kinase
MLDLAQIQSGQIAIAPVPVDLSSVIRDAAAAAGQLAREKGVTLSVAPIANQTRVMADRDLLIQVLLNLLSNAVKFCPSQDGQVTISLVASSGPWVEFAVADNGPGVAPNMRETVFEQFRQVGDAVRGKPPGSGLGLTICRVILAQLGGAIWIEDGAETGAQVHVRLPAADAKQAVVA